MSDPAIHTGPNFFQRHLVPADSTLVRGAMRQAAEWSLEDNPVVRHLVSTAFAVAAVALSLFKTISYLLQLPVKILLNVVRFDPIALVLDFAQSLSDTGRSLLMAAFGATYVIGGMLFPEEVYGFFKPAVVVMIESALEKKQKELETALEEVKGAEANITKFLKLAQESGQRVQEAEEKLRTALPATEAEQLRQEVADAQRTREEALTQVDQIQAQVGHRIEALQSGHESQQHLVEQKSDEGFRERLGQVQKEHEAALEALREEQRAALAQRDEKVERQLAAGQEDGEALQQQHATATARIQEEHQVATEQLVAAHQREMEQLAPLQEQVARFKEEVIGARSEAGTIQQTLADEQSRLERQAAEMTSLREELDHSRQRNADQARQLDTSQEEARGLQGRVAEFEAAELASSAAALAMAHSQISLPSAVPVDDKLAGSLVSNLNSSLTPKVIVEAEVRVAAAEALEDTKVEFLGESFIELDVSEQYYLEEGRRSLDFNGHANAMTYLYHFFASQLSAPEDGAELSFNLETGRVEMAADPNARANFCQILRETYGYNAAGRAIKLHKLDQAGTLTFLDVKKALVSMAAHVKALDLKALFNDLRAGSPSRLMSHLIPEDEKAVITRFDTFEEIPPHSEALHLLMNAYRTLPRPTPAGEMERVSLLQLLSPENVPGQGFGEFNQFHHDLKLLLDAALPPILETNGIDTELPASLDLIEMSMGEHFAKNLGYRELFPGSIVTQFGNTLYELADEIDHTADAVYCRLYAGINALSGKYDAANPMPVHLVTRGTQFKPSQQASGQSLARDFELGGVGKGSFDLRADEMKAMITRYLENVPADAPVHLFLEGHSLGATDSMRLTLVVAKLLLERPDLRAKVVKVSVNPQNPPAIEPAVNDEFRAVLEAIGGEKVLFEITYSLFDQDKVQWIAAGVYLGAKIDSPLLRCRAVHLKPPEPLSALDIHAAKPFTEQADLKYEVAVVEDGEPLAQLLEREHYQHPESGAAARLYSEFTRMATATVFTAGQALLVTPLMRTGAAFGGMFLGRIVDDNNLLDSALY
ncbi:MAG: Chromosome partition protein Smc [Chlamydiae bacterium]|nr:Chromosome partition protein Smc [Chlamydiota bacterium]